MKKQIRVDLRKISLGDKVVASQNLVNKLGSIDFIAGKSYTIIEIDRKNNIIKVIDDKGFRHSLSRFGWLEFFEPQRKDCDY